MLAKEIKRGSVLSYQDAPCMIESVTVQTPSARGANTFYKFRSRNLITKYLSDGERVKVDTRTGQYLSRA
jgi:elongation factor P